MAGQFPGMAGGGISQNNSFMMQQQQAGGAPQPGGGVFTSQPAEPGGFTGQPGQFQGYPGGQPGQPGGYPNPPAYTESGAASFTLASSFMSGSYGAQSPVYSQSGPAARPQMSASATGFPGPGPGGPVGRLSYQHHLQQQLQQQQQQQPGQQPTGFTAPMQGFPSPQQQQQQQQFGQPIQQQQQQQMPTQFAMHQQQQQPGQQQPFSSLQQQQPNLPTQAMMTSAGQQVVMSQPQPGSVATSTPPQTLMTPQQPQPPPQQAHPQPQQAQQRDYNVATLCRLAQETLLDLVSRSQELFNLLKLHQPPNGTAQGANISADKQSKIKQHLEYIKVQFKRLRIYHERISETCAALEFTPVESLIPYKDEPDSKLEDKKQSELCRQAMEEFNEMKEHVQARSRYLKEVIDQLRSIVWDVNTMLAMRHPT